jgi:hypothetical protein
MESILVLLTINIVKFSFFFIIGTHQSIGLILQGLALRLES